MGDSADVEARPGERPLPVYVIHYHAPQWCTETVASLHGSSVPVDVTVIDNGGLDGPVEGARVIRLDANRGFSGGANAAFGDWLGGDSEWCVITSHDLRVDPKCLEIMLDVANRHPRIGLAAPDLTPGGKSKLAKHDALLRRRQSRPVPDRGGPIDGAQRLSWVSGSCMLVRRTMIEDIGPFDERYGSYAEDVDLCFRANRAGWDVVLVREAEATSSGTASWRARTTMLVANGPFAAAKNLGPRRTAIGVGRNFLRSFEPMVQIATEQRPPLKQLQLTAARLRGWAMSLGKVVAWYAHVADSRLRGHPPLEASCHDPVVGQYERSTRSVGRPR